MNSVIRVGIIGLGGMGMIHARNLGGLIRGAVLVAVADPRMETLQTGFMSSSVQRFSDYRRLLEMQEIDAIMVSTASTTHAQVLVDAVECKKPVFCEKPIALTGKDSAVILAMYKDQGIPLQLGFMRRYDPHYRKAYELIADGAIGTPYHFSGLSRDRVGPPVEVVKYSGGFFLDTGVHEFDLARWFLGADITSVFARGGVFTHEEYKAVDDIDQAHVSFKCQSSAMGFVELSRDAIYGYDIRTEILGSKGAIQVAPVNATGTVLLVKGSIVRDTYQNYETRFDEAYRAEIQDFVNCILTSQPFQVTGTDGIRATLVGEAARRSLVSRREEIVEQV